MMALLRMSQEGEVIVTTSCPCPLAQVVNLTRWLEVIFMRRHFIRKTPTVIPKLFDKPEIFLCNSFHCR